MRTYAGRDWQARVMGDPNSDGTGDYAPASWMALSVDSSDEDPANTTLPGEITSGTMARTEAVFAHTDGTETYTLTYTFTVDQLAIVHKMGMYNAPSDGVLVFERLLDGPADLRPGDQIQVVETVNLEPSAV